MAIPLNTAQISGVFALGQWFKVKPGSFYLDAFSLRDWDAEIGDEKDIWNTPFTDYEMGALYEKAQPSYRKQSYGPNSRGGCQTPTASTGCCFIDADTGERVTFSLLEVRAFREDPNSPQ